MKAQITLLESGLFRTAYRSALEGEKKGIEKKSKTKQATVFEGKYKMPQSPTGPKELLSTPSFVEKSRCRGLCQTYRKIPLSLTSDLGTYKSGNEVQLLQLLHSFSEYLQFCLSFNKILRLELINENYYLHNFNIFINLFILFAFSIALSIWFVCFYYYYLLVLLTHLLDQ